MVSPVLFAAATTLLFYYIIKFLKARPSNFPPGPSRWPIIGTYFHPLLQNWNATHKALASWCHTYQSKLVCLFTGPLGCVVTGDYNLIKELFLRKEFAGRPTSYVIKLRTWGKRTGIFFVDGDFWLEQRRFILKNLRDFGFGRRSASLEHVVEDEIKGLLGLIENGPQCVEDEVYVKKGRLVLLPDFLNSPFINSFISILIGEPLPSEKRSDLHKVGQAALKFQKSSDASGRFIVLQPWIRHFAPDSSGYNGMVEGNQHLADYVQSLISRRKLESRHEPEGFIDVYLKENEKILGDLRSKSSFSEDQLLMALIDFLLPTGSTLQQTITLLVQRLLHNPIVQDKMFDEIYKHVGTGRLPTLDDRPNLPFCEATLREGMRIDTLIPLGVAHRATEATTLDKYDLPKDTLVFANLWQLHNDPDVWGDPENFRPERFFDENGGLSLKKDKTFPFGLGKRVCAGETFARNLLFLVLTGLVQHYKFVVPEGHKLPDLNDRKTGLLFTTTEYWVKLQER